MSGDGAAGAEEDMEGQTHLEDVREALDADEASGADGTDGADEASGADGTDGDAGGTTNATDGSSTRSPKVITAGHLNWDVTMYVDRLPGPDGETRIDRLEQSGGGSAANVAVGLVDLGGRAIVYGSVGGDESGALALRGLANAGVDPGHVLIDADQPTSVKYVIVDGDGELCMLANDGANEAFSAADLDRDTLAAADHLHLTSQQPETATQLSNAAHDTDATLSFDPGRRVGERAYGEVLASADLLFLNTREAEAVAETTDIDPWKPEDRVVAIKLGGDGASIRTPHGDVSHPGFPVEPVDTTGAGDAFAAGFLATALCEPAIVEDGFSHDPRDYELPLLVGNACGALAARAVTARVDLSWDAVRERMGESPEADLLIEIRT
ncbi:carbohydrate kinase family protein [Halorubrum vacuolatum]|uniref:Ribokinase n=1 Tax=Halorubrum vacuolatum TaxID=63740 RepID=A0A238VAA4_HALVU|nr:PfkB family carbohydrate kinase [Halorubrum vacuolatum]SNR30977.1 ribokinase [Halorubrum vacuolatum]